MFDYQLLNQRRIQGSLMADAVCSILASLFTSMPNTTFSQNNGVIAMTKCASRRAGIATGFWLILMGIFSKSESIFLSQHSYMASKYVSHSLHFISSLPKLLASSQVFLTVCLEA